MTVLDFDPSGVALRHPLSLSCTIDTLPRNEACRPYRMPTPDGVHHYLVVFSDDLSADRLEHAYIQHLHGRLRPIIWRHILHVPDPVLDPDGFLAARWWPPELPIDLALIRRYETDGIITRWWHGRATGPLLGPSRA